MAFKIIFENLAVTGWQWGGMMYSTMIRLVILECARPSEIEAIDLTRKCVCETLNKNFPFFLS